MKKLRLPLLLAATFVALLSCGDEKDEKPLLDSTSLGGTSTSTGLGGASQVQNNLQKNQPATLRIMTYNIKGIPCLDPGAAKDILTTVGVKKCPLTDDEYQRNLDLRVATIIQKIQELVNSGNGPDVVLLQEAFYSKNSLFTNQAVRSIPARAGYPYFAWGNEGLINNGMDDYWNLVNKNAAKLRGLLSSGLLVLSRYPILGKETVSYGPCATEDCNANKGVLLVRISAPAIGTIDIANTHDQANADQGPIRVQQMGALASWMKSKAITPFIFMGGDFNSHTNPEDAEMTTLRTGMGDLKDGGKECTNAPTTCQITANSSSPRLGGYNLDHIFSLTSAPFLAKPKKAWIYEWSLSTGLALSDHHPVMVEYELTLTP